MQFFVVSSENYKIWNYNPLCKYKTLNVEREQWQKQRILREPKLKQIVIYNERLRT